jgi:gluconate 2-dehydrogenase gamma chain
MTLPNPPRRNFLQQLGGAAGAAWMASQWPAIVAASEHAHRAAASALPLAFEVLTPEQAREVEALTSCIIPSDELPGAKEAGVVYFIDYALKTFAAEARPDYEKGIVSINKLTSELFPGVARFSAATPEQQEKILIEVSAVPTEEKKTLRRNLPPAASSFWQTLTTHTVFGFLVDPDGGGNRDYAGWKVIGRDPEHTFAPPFGAYDKDYAGWQPNPPAAEKK